ncbi:MAG: glutamine-hydrolyzing carbamoyl-phosphate synthase small subunit [Verrucomicrobia bacterium]|nr:glutamine-hydrolyzing carbamoyl-phosphate synthase small subunit [Verrucomicrobiota bacterium]
MALLVLEDGKTFEGEGFGAAGTRVGEICFNTSMTGYQEVLTDPSYFGQIVAMTSPHVGNYGIIPSDDESTRPWVSGFVIEENSPLPSNWQAQDSLSAYLARHDIVGLQGVDTRALTKHLRDKGALKACLTTERMLPEQARDLAVQSAGVVGMDFVKEVTTKEAYDWDPEDVLSQPWVPKGLPVDAIRPGLPPVRHKVVAYDFGLKVNQLRLLRQNGFAVRVVPATTTAEEVLALNPDGVFLSNGPGDPAALDYAHKAVNGLIGKKPIFGICLGHQILGHAFGGKTFKLKFGHRGGNQPVKDLETNKVEITSQNHGFAVDAESLPPEVEVSHINLNDGTVEGLRHRDLPIFSVQYHPEAAPGPHDAAPFFERFARLIDRTK